MNDDIRARVDALKLKAALKQAAVESCPGHLWGDMHASQIHSPEGDSFVCVLCGERVSRLDAIGPTVWDSRGTKFARRK